MISRYMPVVFMVLAYVHANIKYFLLQLLLYYYSIYYNSIYILLGDGLKIAG